MQKRWLTFSLGVAALTVVLVVPAAPILVPADELVKEETFKLPARESYRKPVDFSDSSISPSWQIRVTVSPATFPYPLLKYRFNISAAELESGNAAPLYEKAFAEYQETYRRKMEELYQSDEYFEMKKRRASGEEILIEQFRAFPVRPRWSADCLANITPESEEALYRSLDPVFQLMEKASRKRDADWSYCMEYKGIETLLPHLQNARELARYLQAKADWEIRNGKYDDAVKTIRVGVAMANHVEKSNFPSLISMLVGIAIHGMVQGEIRNLQSQPDAPNLYPALTQILVPADALQSSLQGEQHFLFMKQTALSIFDTIDTASPTECKSALEDLVTVFYWFQPRSRGELPKRDLSYWMTAACTLCYPYARDRLLEKGRTEEEIEKMSVYEVVAPYVLQEIKAAYDLLLVYTSFPRGSAHTDITYDNTVYSSTGSPVNIFLSQLMPATNAAQSAFLRQQQTYELLKITEAIRYYAAVHEGKLPESLDAIQEVYINHINPITNMPYEYKVEGNKATIDYTTPTKARLEIILVPAP